MMTQSNSFDLQHGRLSNDLIELKPLQADDFDRLFAVASDPLIWEMHPIKDRYKQEVFQGFFDGALASKGAFVVFDKSSCAMIGTSRYYDYKPELSQVAIGFTFIAREYWGGEYNHAMKKLMLDYAFQFVDTVLLHIGVDNIRSQKATLKLGAVMTREMGFDHNGKMLPHYEFEIKKSSYIL
jgi:RimJ/RimL family protein N-acetyltransferase